MKPSMVKDNCSRNFYSVLEPVALLFELRVNFVKLCPYRKVYT